MNSKKAFTLIELLVVIAIIALLLSVIIPALKKVKKQAAAVVCLSNMRSMATSWHSYAMDHDSKLVNGHVPRRIFASPCFWVEAPQDRNGVYTGEKALSNTVLPVQEEQNGIRKGLLFPYLEAVDAYHCPADKSALLFSDRSTAGYGSWWNSYSITGMMNGEASKETYLLYNPSATSGWDNHSVFKLSEISSPSSRIVFLENADWRGWLMGSWLMNYTTPYWTDPFAIWHGTTSPFSPLGFADGHAENHRWVNKTTWDMAQNHLFNITPPANEREDIEFMRHAYLPRGK